MEVKDKNFPNYSMEALYKKIPLKVTSDLIKFILVYLKNCFSAIKWILVTSPFNHFNGQSKTS